MSPPETPPASRPGAGIEAGPGALPCLTTLRQRRDFVAAAKARRAPVAGFLLQARERGADERPAELRIGFTCSKKIGNAVTRNRAKRRLRALAREILPQGGRPGWDYVLVGKPEATVSRAFDDLRQDLIRALARIHD